MADEIRIGYFLEDRGHENLLKAFVARVAKEKGLKPVGGYEYGEKIVEEMDLYGAIKADNSLKHFIDDLSSALTRITTQEKID